MLHSPSRPSSSSANTKGDDAFLPLSSSPSPRLTSVARKFNQQELAEKRSTSPFSKYSATSLDPRTLSFFVYDAIKKRSARQLRLALIPFSPLAINNNNNNKKDDIATSSTVPAAATTADVSSSHGEETLQIGRTSTMKFLDMPTFPTATSSSFIFSPTTTSTCNPISKNNNHNNNIHCSNMEDEEPTASRHDHHEDDSKPVRSLPCDAVGRSPLFRACESGQFELVLILLEFYERKYNEFGKFGPPSAAPNTKMHTTPSGSNSLAVSRRGSTFLGTSQNNSEAAFGGATSFSNPPPTTSFTSLMAASKFLSSARQFSNNNNNNNNVMAAVARSTNTVKSLQNVEPNHAKESQLNEAFLAACTFGNLDLVVLLLHHGANPNGPSILDEEHNNTNNNNICQDDKSIIRGDHFGYRPIHGVAQHGYVKAITLMIRKGLKTVNVVDNNGFSPFAHACAEGQDKAALLLKMNGADINSRDKSGFSVLHTAVLRNQKQIVKMLLDESKIQVNTIARNKNNNNSHGGGGGTTPLIDAIRLGHKRIVRLLLESPKCDPCFSPNASPLSSTPASSTSSSPLSFAVLYGKSKSVRRLVERMQRDFEENYEKWNQNRQEHMKTVHFHERIHANKKNNNNDDDSDNDNDEQENEDANDATSLSSFYSSCHCSSELHNVIFDEERESEMVSSINKQDEEGETVLFTAVRLGYNKIIRRLCRGGARVKNQETKSTEEQQIKIDEGMTPKFHFANVSVRNSIDMSPIDLAKQRALDDLFKFNMIRFMERKIRAKPKNERGQSGDDDDDDDGDNEKERKGELSMSDSMFIREWNEKQRQELLRKMKHEEEAVLLAQKQEEEERKRKQEEDDEKQRKRRLQDEDDAKKLKQTSRKPLTLKASKRSAEALLARMEAEDTKKKEDEKKKKQEEEKKKLDEEAEDKKKREEEAKAFVDADEEEEENESSDDDTVKEQNSDDDY